MAVLRATILLYLNVPYVSHNKPMQIQAGNIALSWHNNNNNYYEILLLASLESCACYTSQLPHKEHAENSDTEECNTGSNSLCQGPPQLKGINWQEIDHLIQNS